MIMPKRAIPAQLDATLPRGKWLATCARVDGIEDPKTIDISHPVHGDRIAEIQNLALPVGERWPRGKGAVRIARPGEVDPVAGYFLGHLPICRSPLPRLLIQMVEDIPELGEVAHATALTPTARLGEGPSSAI